MENARLRNQLSGSNGKGNGSSVSSNFSADRFFETQTPPSNLSDFGNKAQEFVQRHAKEGRRVVLVTVNTRDSRVIEDAVFQ